MSNKKQFETSETTLKVVARLLQLKQGEMVTWSALTALIGMDAQDTPGRSYIDSARRILLRQHRRVCDVVTGEGVKWLTEAETAQVGAKWLKKCHRACRRGTRRVRCVRDVAALNREDQIAYYANLARLASVDFQASEKALAETRQDVANNAYPARPDFSRFGNL